MEDKRNVVSYLPLLILAAVHGVASACTLVVKNNPEITKTISNKNFFIIQCLYIKYIS